MKNNTKIYLFMLAILLCLSLPVTAFARPGDGKDTTTPKVQGLPNPPSNTQSGNFSGNYNQNINNPSPSKPTVNTVGTVTKEDGRQYNRMEYTSETGTSHYYYDVPVGGSSSSGKSGSRKSGSSKPSGGGSPSSGGGDPGPGGGGGGGHRNDDPDMLIGFEPGPLCEDYTREVYAPDYVVREVVPLVVKKDQRALVFVNVENIGRRDGRTNVTVKIGNETLTMTDIEVPAGNHALSAGYFKPTKTGTPTISVMVNPNHPAQAAPRTTTCNTCGGCNYTYQEGAEYSYSNNSWSGKVNINELPVDPSPKDLAPRPANASTFIAALPTLVVSPTGGTGASGDTYIGLNGVTTTIGNNRTEASWIDSKPTGADKTYSAKLDMTVKVLDRDRECTALKSGYGFSLQVTCKVTTDYPITERIEAPKKVLCYVPDWGDYTYAVPLERTDNGGAYAKTTTWELPVNPKSQTDARKWYIPEWWSDATDYKFLVAAKGVYTPGGELTAASVHTIRVDSNMYTDDYSIN